MPCAAPRPRARRSLHKRPAGQPAAAANSLKARPCPDRAPRRARSQTRTRSRDGRRSLRLQARARCGCQKFAGHQSEHGLGATPAPRRGVPGALGVPRDVLSLGLLRVRFEFESWLSLGLGSRTALVGVAGRRAVLPAATSGRVRLELRFPRDHVLGRRPERKASCARCACSPAPSQPARQESSPHFPALLFCKWRGRRRAGAHPKRAH